MTDRVRKINVRGRVADSTGTLNTGGIIDTVRFEYDVDAERFVLRLDHNPLPEFWLEIHIPVSQLKDALARAGDQETVIRADVKH